MVFKSKNCIIIADMKLILVLIHSSFLLSNFVISVRDWHFMQPTQMKIPEFNIPSEYSLLDPVMRPPVNCSCGRETEEFRYFKGKKIIRGDQPWLVRIFDKDYPKDDFLCLGTIINNRYVLAPSSCLYKREAGTIGVNFLGSDNTAEIYSVSKLKFHNGFSQYDKQFRHDIALIRLSTKVDFNVENMMVRPVCIHTEKDKEASNLKEKSVMMNTVIWWKHSKREGFPWITFYGKENIYGISDKICSAGYPDTNYTNTICVHRYSDSNNGNILLNENSEYFCHIVPGTPLMKTKYGTERNSSVIVGMATQISECSEKNSNINIFLAIQDYVPWIMKNSYDGTFCSQL